MRRFRKRMQEVGIGNFMDYQDYLEVHPDEFTSLFNTILINVTSFFRDPDTWDFFAKQVVSRVVDGKTHGDGIRVWCVGCASGEEPYTVAMVLAEAVGGGKMAERVKIYATDVDEEALAQARTGIYEAKAIEPIAPELRERYLEPVNGNYAFKPEIRRSVIFGRHDVVTDAPISRVDLIVCRNTLMYFNAETQSRIYKGFHFALLPTGYLFLGKSEMLLTRTSMFSPVDMKRRIFAPVGTEGDDGLLLPARAGQVDERLRRAVFESATIAQLVIDKEGMLVAANSRARSEFGLDQRDAGRPFHDLEVSYRPLELRSRIDRAVSERQANQETAIEWTGSTGETRFLDIEVLPLFTDGEHLGNSITFADVSESHELQAELERSRRELETAFEELQSTVEEFETTNEELRSTNEELETMNQELQSTNEELQTINIELTDRTGQLKQANIYLESILGSLRAGVIVLDGTLTVESWNPLAEDMWGLRAEEARGRSIFALDTGLPVDQLRQPIHDCQSGASAEVILDAVNRRGKAFRCRVTCSPRLTADGTQHGVILLMEDAEG
jgi:two-component system CheB/CheR fusion protein